MTVTHGMNIEEIERIGARLQTHMTEEIRRVAREIEGLVSASSGSWVGRDGEMFRSWWPTKRALIDATADEIYGFGQAAVNNASEQRLASGAPVPGASTTGRNATGPAPYALRVETSARETKSGAVARGVDGSEITLREMSDGTVQVELAITSGMEGDVGDALQLAEISRGKFVSDGGPEWDLDGSVMQGGSRTFTFTDADSAERFFEALKQKQDSLSSVVGGMSFGDIRDVARDLDGQLNGEVDWVGYDGGWEFSAEGTFGMHMSDESGGAGSGITIGAMRGVTVDTVAMDGSTGELTKMSGKIEGTGSVDAGPLSFEASQGGEWSREVHLVRNADGVPVRLEINETMTAGGDVTGGARFLGTESSVNSSSTTQIVNSQVFDLTDPDVSAAYGGATSHSDLYDWAKDHATLGGQTVSAYEGSTTGTSTSVLFSGEWNNTDGTLSTTSVAYRPPGTGSSWTSR